MSSLFSLLWQEDNPNYQIPRTNNQSPNKLQIPITKTEISYVNYGIDFLHLEFGDWILVFIWCLRFGDWDLVISFLSALQSFSSTVLPDQVSDSG